MQKGLDSMALEEQLEELSISIECGIWMSSGIEEGGADTDITPFFAIAIRWMVQQKCNQTKLLLQAYPMRKK